MIGEAAPYCDNRRCSWAAACGDWKNVGTGLLVFGDALLPAAAAEADADAKCSATSMLDPGRLCGAAPVKSDFFLLNRPRNDFAMNDFVLFWLD
jgi:hypothetical protein